MKIINNKKGSAILWTILLTVILVILLASITTAAYAYFNYTTYTVRRQQAYFTARSAVNVLLERYTSIEVETDSTTVSVDDMIPQKGETITVSNFGFDNNMGDATAVITQDTDDPDCVNIKVTATYQEEEYTMTALVARQPLYFGGVAVKEILLQTYTDKSGNVYTPKFELDKDTDLYYYTFINDTVKGSQTANTFNTADICKSGGSIVVNGNLVTQGDAILDSHITVNSKTFTVPVTYSKAEGGHSRQIWNANKFIISNRTFEIDENQGKYSTSVSNVFSSVTNMSVFYCNNGKAFKDNCFGNYSLINADDFSILESFMSVVNNVMANTSIGNFATATKLEDLAVKDTNNDGLATRYIQILSIANSLTETKDYIVNVLKTTSDSLPWPFSKIAAAAIESFNTVYDKTAGLVLNKYGLTVMDISYIDFDSTNISNYGDNGVTPITYMFIEGNNTDGIYCRIKYGMKPTYASTIYKAIDWVEDGIDSIANKWLGILKNTSYVIVYVGKNSTLELGTIDPHILGLAAGAEPAREAANQKYFMSIYGQEGSKVILNDGVQVIGSVQVDKLTIQGDAKVTYSSSNGSQVAKQKIAEYWTVVNYDG